MQIAYLVDYPQHIPTLATWHYQEWGHLTVGDSIASRIQRLSQHTGRPPIPTTWIALDNDTVLGSASVVANDLTTHVHLSPFVASVYVAPPYRGRGVASTLVRTAAAAMQSLGIPRLYLITPDQQRLYGRLGWQAQRDVEYRGEWVTLMALDLGAVPPQTVHKLEGNVP